MALDGRSEALDRLCAVIQDRIAPYTGRVEYGNLRRAVSQYDCGDSGTVTNVALVYETPGGSTDQINISYYHGPGLFALVDEAEEGEVTTTSVEEVIERVTPRILGIPAKRLETLYTEIRRQIDGGTSHAGLFGHLNRIIQSEFRGGSITHLEMRDAMTYAVRYMSESRNGSIPS